MEIIIDRACGLDVHKETAVGCGCYITVLLNVIKSMR